MILSSSLIVTSPLQISWWSYWSYLSDYLILTWNQNDAPLWNSIDDNGCNNCSLIKWKEISYHFNNATYTVWLSKNGELFIIWSDGIIRTLHSAKIHFSNYFILKCGALCTGSNQKLQGAVDGIDIQWIKSLVFSPVNIQFSLRFQWDSIDYVFSIPTLYFEELLAKSHWKEIWFDKNAVEEIYGEAQESLLPEDRALYNKLEWYIKHLVITLK